MKWSAKRKGCEIPPSTVICVRACQPDTVDPRDSHAWINTKTQHQSSWQRSVMMRTIKVRAARPEAQMQRVGSVGDCSDQHNSPSVPHSQCGGEVGCVGSVAYVDGYIKYIYLI